MMDPTRLYKVYIPQLRGFEVSWVVLLSEILNLTHSGPFTSFRLWNIPKPPTTQRLQNPLIKEYSLNHIRDPTII